MDDSSNFDATNGILVLLDTCQYLSVIVTASTITFYFNYSFLSGEEHENSINSLFQNLIYNNSFLNYSFKFDHDLSL